MALTYTVGYSASASGPWTNAQGSPFSTTTDVITGLAPSTQYYFRIITNDTVTGNSSAPVVAGPYTTTAAGPTESIDGTSVVDGNGQILASQTPGQPGGATLDTWKLTAANGQAILNGTIRTETASITMLYYRTHTVYQTSPNGNALTPGGPGWWAWNGTGWTDTTNPVVAGPAITIGTIGAQGTGAPFSVSGSLTGYAVPPSLQYCDNNSGIWSNLPPGASVGTNTFSFMHPAVGSTNLRMSITVRDATNTVVVRESAPFAVTVPGTVTLTGVTLSASNFPAVSPIGTTVGTIGVQTVGGLYTGTNTLTGTDAASFQITGNTSLQTKIATLPTGTYHVNIVATMPGAIGSPFTQAETLTALTGSAIGPTAVGSYINVDFTNLTGNTLYASLFGSSMSADGPTGQFAGNTWANATVQNAAKTTAGFGLPGMYVRINAENLLFGSGTGLNTGFIDNISTNLPRIVDITTAKWSLTLGGYNNALVPTDPTQFSNLAVQLYNRLKNNGTTCTMFEIFNEPDGLDIATYTTIFRATADALHAVDSNVLVMGTGDSWMNSSRMQTLANSCGPSRVHAFSYHQFGSGPSDTDDAAIANGVSRASSDASTLKSALASTPCSGSWKLLGDHNMDSSGSDQRMAIGTIGAVYNFMVLYTAWITDPLTRYASIWDWYGDGNFGLIIDPNNNPSGLPAYSVTATGYALRYARQFMEGKQASCSTVGAGSNVKVIATSNGYNFALLLINTSANISPSGQIALSHWPYNASGTATIRRFEISPANLTGTPTNLTVTAGMVQPLSLPGRSVTILTP